METEELIKLVDGIYKNILEKFNPGARQMINAGKAYLKALHGAAAASRLYVDAITKLARQAQQGTWGGSSDIGSALTKIVEVYKEIQEQQMNILKAFYVDLLVPLETNLEKDTKVVQSEQKRFLQQHKTRSESYSKAAAAIKKQRKKTRAAAGNKAAIAMDKELKNMQVLEEEKSKLDAFCEQSLKNAMTQERRRYGFVLERQCSLAKHYLAYHSQGAVIYQQNIDEWSEVAKTREFLPEPVEAMISNRMRQANFWPDEDVYSSPRSPRAGDGGLDDDRHSITSQLRKTRSMDASCLDVRSIGDAASPVMSLARAKSDFNLTASTHSLIQECDTPQRRPKSMAVPNSSGMNNTGSGKTWEARLARALYAYLSSGDNQLSFLEGDIIALTGDRTKGWQFGENLRTRCSGWFPLAYTEIIFDDVLSPSHRPPDSGAITSGTMTPVTPTGGGGSDTHPIIGAPPRPSANAPGDHSPVARMFGDTINLHRSSANAKQIRRVTGNSNYVPPPSLPAPVPTPTLPFPKSATNTMSHSHSTSFASSGSPYGTPVTTSAASTQTNVIKTSNSSFNFTTPVSANTHQPLPLQHKASKVGPAVGNVSLHSSNDSGFSNDPPPQPEIDYSDEDTVPNTRIPIRQQQQQKQASLKVKSKSMNGQQMRQANSYGTLNNKSQYGQQPQTQQQIASTRMTNGDKQRGIIKRTKSFWKFGRHNDDDILEGMALWKHRDLVDIETVENETNPTVENIENMNNIKNAEINKMSTRSQRSDRSNDSDKTLQNTTNEEQVITEKKVVQENTSSHRKKKVYKKVHKNDKKNLNDSDFENHFDLPNTADNFYNDGGDGLLLRVKTVNRKNILQQYNNNAVSDSENEEQEDSDSVITSDDPYDCIVVDDQTTQTNDDELSPEMTQDGTSSRPRRNKVMEIGKKLEKMAKNTKYKPNSPTETNNNMTSREIEENIDNRRMDGQKDPSFKTFGHDSKKTSETRVRKSSYYSEREEIRERKMDDDFEGGQIIPRTKLVKTNSGSNPGNYKPDLLEYGHNLKNRLKQNDHGSKCEEMSTESGNMYSPWYDLWGMENSMKRGKRPQEIYDDNF